MAATKPEPLPEPFKLISEARPSPTEACSKSLYLLLHDFRQAVDLFFFTVRLASRADEVRTTAAKALMGVGDASKREKYEKILKNPDITKDKLKEFAWENSRNLVLSTTDAVLHYAANGVKEAALRRPELIKSNQTVKIEEVLQFSRYKDLISYIVERKINDLSYGGIRELEAYIESRLGLALFSNEEQKAKFTLLVEIRNIYTHNRGIVSNLFLSRVKDFAD